MMEVKAFYYLGVRITPHRERSDYVIKGIRSFMELVLD